MKNRKFNYIATITYLVILTLSFGIFSWIILDDFIKGIIFGIIIWFIILILVILQPITK